MESYNDGVSLETGCKTSNTSSYAVRVRKEAPSPPTNYTSSIKLDSNTAKSRVSQRVLFERVFSHGLQKIVIPG